MKEACTLEVILPINLKEKANNFSMMHIQHQRIIILGEKARAKSYSHISQVTDVTGSLLFVTKKLKIYPSDL